MECGRTAEKSDLTRWLGRRVGVSIALIAAVSGAFSSAEADFSVAAEPALATGAAHGQWLFEPPSERTGGWADGAIDSLEKDDLSCDHRVAIPSERTEALAPLRSHVPRFASGELARPYPARGPPSA